MGRQDEARAALADALAHFPGVSIESFARTPDWSDTEREKMTEAMRKAGLPALRDAGGPQRQARHQAPARVRHLVRLWR